MYPHESDQFLPSSGINLYMQLQVLKRHSGLINHFVGTIESICNDISMYFVHVWRNGFTDYRFQIQHPKKLTKNDKEKNLHEETLVVLTQNSLVH